MAISGTLIGIIVALVLGLVLVGIVYYAYRVLRKKVRDFSSMAFGTTSLLQGLQKVEDEYAVTPKSVSGATDMYLPQIIRDFPEFHYDEMKTRAENVLISYLAAISNDAPEKLTEGTKELKNALGMKIDSYRSRGVRHKYDQCKIHQTEIFRYRKQMGRCSILFQSALEYFEYEEKNGSVSAGSKTTKRQERYNVECIYIQDRDVIENVKDSGLAMNCPNCGAPLPKLGAKVCAYCDTPILEFNIRIWNFSKVEIV